MCHVAVKCTTCNIRHETQPVHRRTRNQRAVSVFTLHAKRQEAGATSWAAPSRSGLSDNNPPFADWAVIVVATADDLNLMLTALINTTVYKQSPATCSDDIFKTSNDTTISSWVQVSPGNRHLTRAQLNALGSCVVLFVTFMTNLHCFIFNVPPPPIKRCAFYSQMMMPFVFIWTLTIFTFAQVSSAGRFYLNMPHNLAALKLRKNDKKLMIWTFTKSTTTAWESIA